MKKPLVIGITGGIGSGKSSVIKAIVEKYNTKKILVLDCDTLFKKTVVKDDRYLNDLEKVFKSQTTNSIFLPTEDGSRKLNGEVLIRGMASGGTNFCSVVNDIGWGYFRPVIQDEAMVHAMVEGYDIVLIETALMWEIPICYQCDLIIDLITDESIRRERVNIRDASRGTVLNRKLMDIQGSLSNRYNLCWRDSNMGKFIAIFNLGVDNKEQCYLEEFLNTHIDNTLIV